MLTKEKLGENLKYNWVWFLFGILVIFCSIVLLGMTTFMRVPLIIAIGVGVLVIIGSLLDPREDDSVGGGSPKAPLETNPTEQGNLPAQYQQTQENQRFLLRLLWEVPTIAITISSAFLVAAYNFFPNATSISGSAVNAALIRGILLFFGSLLILVSFLAVVKHRHFRGVWLESIREMEIKMHLTPVPFFTRETIKTKRFWSTDIFHRAFLKISVETWLANVLFIISIIFLLLSTLNLYEFAQTLNL